MQSGEPLSMEIVVFYEQTHWHGTVECGPDGTVRALWTNVDAEDDPLIYEATILPDGTIPLRVPSSSQSGPGTACLLTASVGVTRLVPSGSET